MRRHPRDNLHLEGSPFPGVVSRASFPRSGCNAAGLAGTRYHLASQPASRQTARRRHADGRWTGTTGGSSHARSAGNIPEHRLMEKKKRMEKTGRHLFGVQEIKVDFGSSGSGCTAMPAAVEACVLGCETDYEVETRRLARSAGSSGEAPRRLDDVMLGKGFSSQRGEGASSGVRHSGSLDPGTDICQARRPAQPPAAKSCLSEPRQH